MGVKRVSERICVVQMYIKVNVYVVVVSDVVVISVEVDKDAKIGQVRGDRREREREK